MKRKIKAGFLPLYIKLYDDTTPYMRKTAEKFVAETGDRLEKIGIDIVRAPICRVKSEFEEAVHFFEEANVDLIITLNVAYSPSLESCGVLSSTKLPILILDTTFHYEFTPFMYADSVNYNHGIHGVMDLCNMLRRNGKKYEIVAGYFGEVNPGYEDMVRRILAYGKACVIRNELTHAKAGLVGGQFEGMGDFRIPFDELRKKLGIEVVEYDMKSRKYIDAVTDEEIDAEYALDSERYTVTASREVYNKCARAALAMRKWIKDEGLTAFTMNFLAADKSSSFPTMPFAEASLEMANGIGYAGEGDVLTASFVGALMTVFDEVTFAEIFCPDWRHNNLFFSHMGEYNVALSSTEKKPVMSEVDFIYGDSFNPVCVVAPFKPGRSAFVSLNPMPDGTFDVYCQNGEMLYTPFENEQSISPNGWWKPDVTVPEFLESYCKAGGIHHAAVVYGDDDIAEIFAYLSKVI